jgi:hypothetical protein
MPKINRYWNSDPDDYGEITVSFSVNVKQKKG